MLAPLSFKTLMPKKVNYYLGNVPKMVISPNNQQRFFCLLSFPPTISPLFYQHWDPEYRVPAAVVQIWQEEPVELQIFLNLNYKAWGHFFAPQKAVVM